jgi:hypothetical protein
MSSLVYIFLSPRAHSCCEPQSSRFKDTCDVSKMKFMRNTMPAHEKGKTLTLRFCFGIRKAVQSSIGVMGIYSGSTALVVHE